METLFDLGGDVLDSKHTLVVDITTQVGDAAYATAETFETRVSDHGDALGQERVLHSRDTGRVSGQEEACLHNHPDHRLPDGGQESGATYPKGRQLPPLCSHRFACSRSTPPDRRRSGALRRARPAGDGASDRDWKTLAR